MLFLHAACSPFVSGFLANYFSPSLVVSVRGDLFLLFPWSQLCNTTIGRPLTERAAQRTGSDGDLSVTVETGASQ